MNEFSIFGTQVTASAVVVFLFRVIEHKFPVLATLAPGIKRTITWIIAAGAALGVHASFTSASGTLIITGLTLAGIAHALWHWIQSVALQEWIHNSTK